MPYEKKIDEVKVLQKANAVDNANMGPYCAKYVPIGGWMQRAVALAYLGGSCQDLDAHSALAKELRTSTNFERELKKLRGVCLTERYPFLGDHVVHFAEWPVYACVAHNIHVRTAVRRYYVYVWPTTVVLWLIPLHLYDQQHVLCDDCHYICDQCTCACMARDMLV
jgi:hypothetical protein